MRFRRTAGLATMPSPEQKTMSERLCELQLRDAGNQQVFRDGTRALHREFDPLTMTVMYERHEVRCASSKFFESILHKVIAADSDVLGTPTDANAAVCQTARDRTQERYRWLGTFEGEIAAEEAYIRSHKERFVRERLQREQQIAAWKTELDSNRDRRSSAIKLVLKFKVNQQIIREARTASILARLTSPSFPVELRLHIMKFVVGSQVSCWPVTESNGLAILAEHCFKWPREVTENDRSTLIQTAEDVLFKACIVKLPLAFPQELVLATPSSLEGKLHNVRTLALELKIVLNNATNRDLNRSIDGMSRVGVLFPMLKVCVITLLVQGYNMYLLEGLVHMLPRYGNLTYDEKRSAWEHVSLKESIIRLLESYTRSGPGQRKLLQLNAQGGASKRTGPLIEVDGPISIGDEQRSGEGLTSNNGLSAGQQESSEDEFIVNARRIFDLMMMKY